MESNPINRGGSDSADSSQQSVAKQQIKVGKIVYPQIYSYRVDDDPVYDGHQKIGYTERQDVRKRIYEQNHTAGFRRDNYTILWSAPAIHTYTTDGWFKDKVFHRYLERMDVPRSNNLGTEWFYFNGTPERSKKLFDDFRNNGSAGLQLQTDEKIPYTLRPEQAIAVEKTINYFQSHQDDNTADSQPSFLWNAKPRFGKTLAAYDLAAKLKAKNVLVVTNRPAIAHSWYQDYKDFVEGYYFISNINQLIKAGALSRDEFIATPYSKDQRQITFLSLQDLKGGKLLGGNYDKLSWVTNLDWDLLIIDEAHEGVDTDRTDKALEQVKRKYTLYLSGTPFKALAKGKFKADAIYNWTYLDEQKAKQAELNNLALNENEQDAPHINLPDLRMFTYRISEMTTDTINQGVTIDDQNYDYSFSINDLFAVADNSKKFIRENDVKNFLHNLATNEKYPFSTPELRNELKHTFWYVGNRINSVKALAELLKKDPVFKDYEIVIAAGNGQSFEDEANDIKSNEKSFERVKKAIKNHDKTITLSCGQLTTGVTVKEWAAVLMLTDINSTPLYMQAAFRAQNPYAWTEVINGQPTLKRKKSAYLFDFSPTRVLRMYDEFANNLNPEAVAGSLTADQRTANVAELLNFFPVISEDINGQMVELDATQVFSFQDAIAAKDIVRQRFMSNLLFSDAISNVFNIPKVLEPTFDKMGIERNKQIRKTDRKMDIDHTRQLEQNKEIVVNENKKAILGEKIYAAHIDQAASDSQDLIAEPDKRVDYIVDRAISAIETPIATLKETNHLTNSETDDMRKAAVEKIKIAADEFIVKNSQNIDELCQSLKNVIEVDLVENTVRKIETEKIEEEKKSTEDLVKDHLRAFTRTIPMCIMANHGKDINVDNFDIVISDEDFLDLTNITKDEFHMLRDGFDYDDEATGERKHFDGAFNKYRFNAAIKEFMSEKEKLGKYWLGDQHDIFEFIPNQKNNQIFTPPPVVKMMVDNLESQRPELFQRTDSTFIDLYMKSGLYITEISKRLFTNTRSHYPSDEECIKHILEHQVFGLAPTKILYDITSELIFSNIANIKQSNFKFYDLLDDAKAGTAKQAINQLYKEQFNNSGDSMFKFDAVVGNPPYNEMTDKNKMSRSIYPEFVKSAQNISDLVSLIIPARWMSGESGPYRETSNFVATMTNGSHLRTFSLYPNSQDLFGNVDIKGGVCYFVWDKIYQQDLVRYSVTDKEKTTTNNVPFQIADNIIIRFPELVSIVQKIFKEPVDTDSSMKTLVSSRNPFGFVSDLFTKNNEGVSRISENKLAGDDYLVYGLIKNKRAIRYIPNGELKKNIEGAKSWKVMLPRANGSGVFGEIFSTPMIGTPMIGTPMSICTDTFLQVGQFDNEIEAGNLLSYVKTKFFRALVGVKKTAVFNYKDCFTFVPQQDFTANSDIDWSQSIADIDQQLYRKYGLTAEEIDFIETRVKPMD